MAAPSVDNPVRADVVKSGDENVPRQKLREILEMYGRPICDEPQRCEGLLRDLCAGHRREIFLLVAALRERVVPDILASLDILPDAVIVSNLVKKLCDNLGLSKESSQWAAESWMLAIREAPAVGRIRKEQAPRAHKSRSAAEASMETPEAEDASPVKVDWPWIGLCVTAILSTFVALAVVERVSFYYNWVSFLGWLAETGILAAGLGVGLAGEYFAARRFVRREAPHHLLLDPVKTPAALLVEVLVLLTQPLAPLGVLALWLAGWVGGLYGVGQTHDLALNLGHLIQSIPIGFFVFKWAGWMTSIQGRISASMVRRR